MQFTKEQVATAFSGLMIGLSDKTSPVLDRSDVRPHLIGDTGVWLDPDCPGDEHGSADEYMGFGMVIPQVEDADTKEPFVLAFKVHLPSFSANPRRYAMNLVVGVAKGLDKMNGEMHETARKAQRKLRAQLESGAVKIR